MKHLLPYLPAAAIVLGVGLLVYGYQGGFGCSYAYGRFPSATCNFPSPKILMTVGAMLVAAGVLGKVRH